MKSPWGCVLLVAAIMSLMMLEGTCRPPGDDDAASGRTKRQIAAQERQFVGGLSTLGALVQPILFMIGVANFMGRIPMFFNRMRDRFSMTLSSTGAPAGAGRKKRSLFAFFDHDIDSKSGQALKMLNEAQNKYHRGS